MGKLSEMRLNDFPGLWGGLGGKESGIIVQMKSGFDGYVLSILY